LNCTIFSHRWEHYLYTDPDISGVVTAKILTDPEVLVAHIWQHLTKDKRIILNPNSPRDLINTFPFKRKSMRGSRRAAYQVEAPNSVTEDSLPKTSAVLQPVEVIARSACPVIISTTEGFL